MATNVKDYNFTTISVESFAQSVHGFPKSNNSWGHFNVVGDIRYQSIDKDERRGKRAYNGLTNL